MKRLSEIPEEHCLKEKLKEKKIPLWKIAYALGMSETVLWKMLKGIKKMPKRIENSIINILEN